MCLPIYLNSFRFVCYLLMPVSLQMDPNRNFIDRLRLFNNDI
jgi:hypothetical protein